MAEEDSHPESSAATAAASRPTFVLRDAPSSEGYRVQTGLAEFDRVLGGGLVVGSLVLIGGEPGIGKSTLLLQAAHRLAESGAGVLYACGEESVSQVRMRAERLGISDSSLALLPETDVQAVEATVLAQRPGHLVVDSIQTLVDTGVPGVAGSVGQVRACAARLMRLAKAQGITIVLVGHVTKEGAIAGPRVLEHLVDTVLYFEGDSDHAFRVVRAAKNRFGSVSEVGLFEMTARGLEGVSSPSRFLVTERATPVAGSCVMAAIEGTRPLLVEIQALVTPTYSEMPRRHATGIDRNRLAQVLAVLERAMGRGFGGHDVYVAIAGGVRVVEPAADLALALALASALSGKPLPKGWVAFGELGLTGEVRPVAGAERRVSEALALGYSTCLAPKGASSEQADSVRRVDTLEEGLISAGLGS